MKCLQMPAGAAAIEYSDLSGKLVAAHGRVYEYEKLALVQFEDLKNRFGRDPERHAIGFPDTLGELKQLDVRDIARIVGLASTTGLGFDDLRKNRVGSAVHDLMALHKNSGGLNRG